MLGAGEGWGWGVRGMWGFIRLGVVEKRADVTEYLFCTQAVGWQAYQ